MSTDQALLRQARELAEHHRARAESFRPLGANNVLTAFHAKAAETLGAIINAHLSEPQAASHPLADDQIDDEWAEAGKRGTGHMATYLQAREFCRAIEAAHGIGAKT